MKIPALRQWHTEWLWIPAVAAAIALASLAGCAAEGTDLGPADPALNPQPLPPVDGDADEEKGSAGGDSQQAPPPPAVGGQNGTNGGTNGSGSSSGDEPDAGTNAQPQSAPLCTLPGLC